MDHQLLQSINYGVVISIHMRDKCLVGMTMLISHILSIVSLKWGAQNKSEVDQPLSKVVTLLYTIIDLNILSSIV